MNEFFTLGSLATLSGAVGAVIVIINSIRHVFNWGPRWFGFLVSLGVAIGALFITAAMSDSRPMSQPSIANYIVALLNGCLIYSSAFGIQNTLVVPRTDATSQASGLSLQGVEIEQSDISGSKLNFRASW